MKFVIFVLGLIPGALIALLVVGAAPCDNVLLSSSGEALPWNLPAEQLVNLADRAVFRCRIGSGYQDFTNGAVFFSEIAVAFATGALALSWWNRRKAKAPK